MTESVTPLVRLWRRLQQTLASMLIPALAILTALIVAAGAVALSGANVLEGYWGLWDGAFGSKNALIETTVRTTPYIFAGLALTVAFRGGLFNIGVEGQFFVGSILAAWIGYAFKLPAGLHLIVALLVGTLGGGLWGA